MLVEQNMVEDPAFIWERAARPQPPRVLPREAVPAAEPGPAAAPPRWVTLREAAEATGLKASTIRGWARRGKVPTRLWEGPQGPRRMVGAAETLARARGREETPPAPPAPAPALPAASDGERVPPGSMLVPIDAWEKMLQQLGNLHEAGRQLAEARERAAKAETEARFLRERLAELREAARGEGGNAAVPAAAPAEPRPAPSWLRVYRSYRQLLRRRR